ncbi:MAG: DUF429 domain-containing protein [Flavobacteriales bacterium]|nr:DUF429 domain-containing protein [Flavobacteriales bacterium]
MRNDSEKHPLDQGIVGIDLGSRSTGNTVICSWEQGRFVFHRAPEAANNDGWLLTRLRKLAAKAIYVDAPLSLPGAFFGKGSDHFFRLADKEAGGMSPMFLGGLTARAIQLAESIRAAGAIVHEAYPAALIRAEWKHLELKAGRAVPKQTVRLMAGTFQVPSPEPADRHELDAWLCWLIGLRHVRGEAKVFGDPEEGAILA